MFLSMGVKIPVIMTHYLFSLMRYYLFFCCHRYDIMLSCWEKEATERPKFSDLVDTVNDQMERDSGHLELSLAPTGQIASPPPSPRAEVELKAGVTCSWASYA